MPSVEEVAAQIVAREGGYVNDPDDPGGATNYGVTIGTMKSLGLDLNKDRRVDATDVRMLTRAQAQQLRQGLELLAGHTQSASAARAAVISR